MDCRLQSTPINQKKGEAKITAEDWAGKPTEAELAQNFTINAVAMAHTLDAQRGQSVYTVTDSDGETYDFEVVKQVALISYRHMSGAEDDPSRYDFKVQNGLLVVSPKEESTKEILG